MARNNFAQGSLRRRWLAVALLVVCAELVVLALGAIRAIRRAGLSVPGDVSVVGYDDSAFMNCTDPPLTTVRQPIESMGQAAVALLVNQMENMAVYPEELLFEPELVVRGSTAPAPPTPVAQAAPASEAGRAATAAADADAAGVVPDAAPVPAAP